MALGDASGEAQTHTYAYVTYAYVGAQTHTYAYVTYLYVCFRRGRKARNVGTGGSAGRIAARVCSPGTDKGGTRRGDAPGPGILSITIHVYITFIYTLHLCIHTYTTFLYIHIHVYIYTSMYSCVRGCGCGWVWVGGCMRCGTRRRYRMGQWERVFVCCLCVSHTHTHTGIGWVSGDVANIAGWRVEKQPDCRAEATFVLRDGPRVRGRHRRGARAHGHTFSKVVCVCIYISSSWAA